MSRKSSLLTKECVFCGDYIEKTTPSCPFLNHVCHVHCHCRRDCLSASYNQIIDRHIMLR